MLKRWVLRALDKDAAAALAEDSGLHPFLSVLLQLRGVDSAEAAADFLGLTDQTEDPFGLMDMDAAVDRIQRALDNGEKMMIYGDYDADGVTATALLYSYLRDRGADVDYRIPTREGSGYGLQESSISEMAEQQVRLIITVDNGVTAVSEVAAANAYGIDVVVTDHHKPKDVLPAAVAVVDPHRPDCPSVFKGYAGVGVAYKLVSALEGDSDPILERYADMIALGTLADVMPLEGENRQLVRRGLKKMNESPIPGIAVLAQVAGMGDKPHTSSTAMFTLSPRINAAGRVGNPDHAAKLLLAATEEEARPYAEELQKWNVERQAMEAAIVEKLTEQLDADPEQLSNRVLILRGDQWHIGVIGIIAARMVERYGKPCVVLSVRDGEARGSGRSVAGFSLFDALGSCADIVTRFGGHEMAAGVSLSEENIPAFCERINAFAAERYPVMPIPELKIDCKLRPSQIDLEKLELIGALEPFGAGNPAPLFGLYHMRLDNITPVGGGKHLRLSVSRDDTRLTVMKFQTTPDAFPVECGAFLDLAITIERSTLRNATAPSLVVKDLRFSDTDQEQSIRSYQRYDDVILRRPLDEDTRRAMTPDRDEIAVVYRFLRGRGQFCGTVEQLCHCLGEKTVDHLHVLLILGILRQAGLLTIRHDGERLTVAVTPTEGKTDLHQTAIMQFLQRGE